MAAGRNNGYNDNEKLTDCGETRDFYYERDLVNSGEREPGELSSGSDGDFVSEPMINIENGMSKKRKFSPIVWDREESSKMKVVKMESPHTHPPLPPQLKKHSPVFVEDGDARSKGYDSSRSQPSPANALVDVISVRPSASDSPKKLSLSPPNHHNQEAGQMDDEDIVSSRNISASRWADETHSPKDEGEVSDDRDNYRRKMQVSGLVDSRRNAKSLSPEIEELGQEGHRVRSSESSEGQYSDNDLRRNDYMEIDDESDSDHHNSHHSDTESDEDAAAPEPVAPPQRSIDMLQGCRSVDEFERLNKIDEGTYGVVYRAKDKKTGEVVALKKVKMEKEREGFPLTSLREINILLSFHHPSIVDVKEVVVGSNLDSIFMVMEYMEHDLKGLMESMKQPFSQSEVKCLMLQLLEGVKYLHDNWVLHRDLKTSNLLLNNRGELKICDFGLSRQYGSPLKPYTHLVVTLWYRAPELLLGAKQYSTAIDMWSLGCIMAELLAKQPLFSGKTEVDQLDKIFRTIGTPNEAIWPGFSKLPGVKVNFVKQPYNLLRKKFPATSFTGSPILSDAGFDLLNKLLTYDPQKRITAEDALNHTWFKEVPLPKSKDFMPTFPAQHAQDRRLRRIMKSPDPLEEQRRKELQQKEFGTRGLFG